MEKIDDQLIYKHNLINYVITSNKNSNYHIFYEERELLFDWLFNLKKNAFFKAVVLLNFDSYSGYFSLAERYKLKEMLLTNDQNAFEDMISEYEKPYLCQELIAHNMWLARAWLNHSHLEYKFLIAIYKELFPNISVFNFKNKIRYQEKVYDLAIFLTAFLQKKITLSDNSIDWLKDIYSVELEIIKNSLDEILACEI